MSDWQPDIGRLLATVRHEEPDRVPLAEFSIDEPLLDKLAGKPVRTVEDHVAAQVAAGHDFIYLRANYEYHGAVPVVATGTPLAWEWARSHASESQQVSADGPLHELADLEDYPWPDPRTLDVAHFARASAVLPSGMGIITGVGGIFTRTWMLMGYEHFCLSLADNPDLPARAAERIGAIQCQVLRRLIGLPDVRAVWYGDDLAYTESLMVPPPFLRRHVFPWIEELAGIAHGAGLPFIMHTDGVLWEVLDDLIALGVDALHPFEPKAMDICEVKRRYGRKLALFGNIDLGYTLARGAGKPEDIRAEVRQKIRRLAPGGGYAVASGGGAARYISPDNYVAMRDATWEFGTYPITV